MIRLHKASPVEWMVKPIRQHCLRCNMDLLSPNDERPIIEADEEAYWWRDGATIAELDAKILFDVEEMRDDMPELDHAVNVEGVNCG